MPEPLTASSLLLYEFRQSVRFQGYLFAQDQPPGFQLGWGRRSSRPCRRISQPACWSWRPSNWADVQNIAERLSSQHTLAGGHRALDILHVATALHLGVDEFLTFDQNQRALAAAEGLKSPL